MFVDAERAGSGLLNFAVDDLEKHAAEVTSRGLQPDDTSKRTRVSGCRPSAIPTRTRSRSLGVFGLSTDVEARVGQIAVDEVVQRRRQHSNV